MKTKKAIFTVFTVIINLLLHKRVYCSNLKLIKINWLKLIWWSVITDGEPVFFINIGIMLV